MASKTRSKHAKELYNSYKASQKWKANRTKKLEKLAKVHPNNAQITEALKNVKYRRKTPTKSVWTSVSRSFAMLVRQVQGKFEPNMLHPNDDLRNTAMMKRPKNFVKATKHEGSMFSIRTRLKAQGVNL